MLAVHCRKYEKILIYGYRSLAEFSSKNAQYLATAAILGPRSSLLRTNDSRPPKSWKKWQPAPSYRPCTPWRSADILAYEAAPRQGAFCVIVRDSTSPL